jgi:hypothetical protein
VFFVIDQGYVYDEEREEYEKGSGSPRFRLPILKLTAMGLRWNDGFFPCRYSSLFERLWGSPESRVATSEFPERVTPGTTLQNLAPAAPEVDGQRPRC